MSTDLPARLRAAAEAMALAQSDPTGVLLVASRNSPLPALALEAAAELERVREALQSATAERVALESSATDMLASIERGNVKDGER